MHGASILCATVSQTFGGSLGRPLLGGRFPPSDERTQSEQQG